MGMGFAKGKGILWSALLCGCLLISGQAASASNCALCGPAHDGDLTGVAAALGHHAPVNARDSNGWTPLLYAAGMRHEDVALLLLEHGADGKATLSDGRTVLFFAVIDKEPKLVQALLDHKVNASERYSDGWSPLLLAAQFPADTQMLEMLLSHHADTNVATSKGVTPLNLVLQDSWDPDKAPPLEALQLLLANGANPNLSGAGPGWSPIAWAATTGRSHKGILALMIGAGANPNILDSAKRPILYDVLWDNDPELTFLLLKAGANWKIPDSDNIPIMSAACETGPERIRLLARHGVELNWRGPGIRNLADDRSCWTRENLLALVDQQLYLDAEMPVPTQGFAGASPLYTAAATGTGVQIQALVLAGADLPEPDRAGHSSAYPDPELLFAAILFNPNKAEAYEMLISYGVDVLAKNALGQTTLEALDAVNVNSKSDPAYLRGRGVLENAMHTRMPTRGFLLTARDLAEHAPPEALQETRKKIFLEGLELYHRDSGSIELGAFLAWVADRMTPVPPTSPDALVYENAAKAAYESAHTRSEMLGVALQYEQACALAPWVGAYYKNLCTVYELSGSYGRAKRNCARYLLSDPSDAAAIEKQMERLQGEIEQAIK